MLIMLKLALLCCDF